MGCHNPAGEPDWTAKPPTGERQDAMNQNGNVSERFVSQSKTEFYFGAKDKWQEDIDRIY